jgi:phosphatidylinositol 3-kinase
MTSGCGYVSEKGSSIIEFSFNLPNKQFNANSLCVVADWDSRQDNLYEYQYRCLAHDMLPRGTSDPNIKPNLQDKENLERIVQDVRSQMLSSEDMDLLYKFRYTLTENKKALTKFLLSVIWTPSEVAELPLLLSKWQRIDVADALKLLGREKAFRRPLIREYAVNMLAVASDEELLTYLLQLVQALRYDDIDLNTSNNIQATDTTEDNIKTNTISNTALSPLATFLIQRGCSSLSVANYLYWYLKVETKPSMEDVAVLNSSGEGDGDDSSMVMFQMILDKFVIKLQESPEGKKMCAQLQGLDEYMNNISDCQTIVRNVNSKQDAKQEQMCQLLSEHNLQNVPSTVTSVPYPLNPTIQLTGLDTNSAKIFASAVYPCRLTFHTQNNDVNTDKNNEKDAISLSELSIKDENTSPPPVKEEEPRVMIIFKSGDDLRQDQLIMQMTNLIDSLLKKVNLDLKMNMYGILAVSKDFGIMEFVQKSEPVSKVLKDHKSLGNFLRLHNPGKY